MFSHPGEVTRETAMQVPTVSGGIDLIGSLIASTPVKLYREHACRAHEVEGDPRLRLLNDETGDTLCANDFWRAVVRDYYLGKGGFAYIQRTGGRIAGLYYVDERNVSILRGSHPIFKEYDIAVQGKRYLPHDFLRILRNTRDGMEGVPITRESSTLIATAYQSLLFEQKQIRRGGTQRSFALSERRLDPQALKETKELFRQYSLSDEESVLLLNNGVKFQPASSTAVEMQLNENKHANAEEFAKIFHIPAGMISGTASQSDIASLARLAAIPLMKAIECALNRDLLLESEKGSFYFAFDTKELLKGDMQSRFAAYKTALEANFMQIDEVRFAENLDPLGLTWVKLGLQDVLYDPRTRQIYTPNTNQTAQMDEKTLPGAESGGVLDERAQMRRENGQFGESDGMGGKDGTPGQAYEKPTGFAVNDRGEKTLDSAERKRYDDLLIGRQTSDGVKISGLSQHAYDRAAQRHLSPGQMLDALRNEPQPSRSDPTCRTYDGDGHRMVVNAETGKIVTIMRRRSAK